MPPSIQGGGEAAERLGRERAATAQTPRQPGVRVGAAGREKGPSDVAPSPTASCPHGHRLALPAGRSVDAKAQGSGCLVRGRSGHPSWITWGRTKKPSTGNHGGLAAHRHPPALFRTALHRTSHHIAVTAYHGGEQHVNVFLSRAPRDCFPTVACGPRQRRWGRAARSRCRGPPTRDLSPFPLRKSRLRLPVGSSECG